MFESRGAPDQAVLRLRRFSRPGHRAKGYRHSLEGSDEASGEVLAGCDLAGRATLAPFEVTAGGEGTWRVSPSRRVMPTRWVVSDPGGRTRAHLDQKLLGKLVNPLYRVALAVLDERGEESFRIVDPRKSAADRTFGLGPREWAILAGVDLVAGVVRLPGRAPARRGLLGRLAAVLESSDAGIVTLGSEHVLAAPGAIARLLLLEELTDAPVG
jgi:hypothetical protein